MPALNNHFPKSIRWVFQAYDQAWLPALPGLRQHVKLREGFAQRLLVEPFRQPADIWIQAASAGESHLAGMLAARLSSDADLRIVTTTNTRQGMEILQATSARLTPAARAARLQAHLFPFDRPSIMRRAVASLSPRLMVLLETELWPGLLYTLRQAGIPVIMVNARLQARSLRVYRLWPALWRHLAPDRILAVSREDADRLGQLFGPHPVERMPNMKFDRIAPPAASVQTPRDWTRYLPPDTPLVVLGSIRRQEERAMIKIIDHLRSHGKPMVIGLYPRHIHRIAPLCRRLRAAGLPYCRRSRIEVPLTGGTVIVGDVFGELAQVYPSAAAAFVGGSLAPLGGHNFLEPLLSGIAPVIGPHWQSFEWVGAELFRDRLVHVAANWRTVARYLLQSLNQNDRRADIRHRAAAFCDRHRGGTDQACQAIREVLDAT